MILHADIPRTQHRRGTSGMADCRSMRKSPKTALNGRESCHSTRFQPYIALNGRTPYRPTQFQPHIALNGRTPCRSTQFQPRITLNDRESYPFDAASAVYRTEQQTPCRPTQFQSLIALNGRTLPACWPVAASLSHDRRIQIIQIIPHYSRTHSGATISRDQEEFPEIVALI